MEVRKMTVRMIRKEMDFEKGLPPSNDAPIQPASAPMAQPKPAMDQVPDHTHPEYDQALVKLQELEGEIHGQQPGGIEQESLDEGRPENDKGKPTGGQEPITDTQRNQEPKKIESYIRRLIREELTGVPERDIGKALDKSGPENTQNIPQSKQPPVGTAPSGGGFDSDDKTNKEDGDETEGKLPKPTSDFGKPSIKKNKLERAKMLIEKAKALMKEANDPDPSAPNPGADIKDPSIMDGSVPNKSPLGGTEQVDGDEDPEANADADLHPKMKEFGFEPKKPVDDDDEEDEDKIMDKTVERVYRNLSREIKKEKSFGRQSVVGMTARTNSATQAAHEQFLDIKGRANNSIKEYLQKAGHSQALGMMSPQYG